MLEYAWTSVTITTNQQANAMLQTIKENAPTIGAFDTETNGLHIILCTPFLFQFGFINEETKQGFSYVVDLEQQPDLAKQVIRAWQKYAAKLDIYLGHNVKFDMHMMANIGLPYLEPNLSDTMFYIRYAHDALTEENGGPPLALKKYTAKYITHTAKIHEAILEKEKSEITKIINSKLRFRLKGLTPPEEYGAKSYTIGLIEEIFKDPVIEYTDLPEDFQKAYLDWLHFDVPIYIQDKVVKLVETDMIPYNKLNRQNVIKYAHYDIIYTLEIYIKLKPVIEARGNQLGLKYENDIIVPLYEMERTGFKADLEYLLTAKKNLKDYILTCREQLYDLAGCKFKIGQHVFIRNLLQNEFGLDIDSTGKSVLEQKLADLISHNPDDPAITLINLVQKLRTLEKWYSAYILRFIKSLKYTDRLYTTINQVGTVSGRVTSDFQQFPKEAIKTDEDVELFQPRKMIKISEPDYDALFYLDYSQIELRFQAIYTILVGHPDLNLCRAYMPYKCVDSNGVLFDYNNPDHILNWDKDWYYEEDPTKHWIPTDVHGETTTAATGLHPGDPHWSLMRRDVGKKVNFAKNYGAQRKRIRVMFPHATEEEIDRINNAYYIAFPGVKFYHEYCYRRADNYPYTSNLFGVKYYGVTGHKLINMLIQGSAAFYLKIKIKELYDYSVAHNVKSKLQMQIHDELSWEHFKGEDPAVFFEFQNIMGAWPEALVPIIADMEFTKTTWAEKKGAKDIETVRLHFST